MPTLEIGEVAKLSAVGVDTIRYYERLGLLPEAPRRSSGYRVFDERTVERIQLVKQLQDLGLTLQEIVEMIRAVGQDAAGCSAESSKISAALARTESRLAVLMAMRTKLRQALRRCERGQCKIIDRVIESEPRRSSTARRSVSPTG